MPPDIKRAVQTTAMPEQDSRAVPGVWVLVLTGGISRRFGHDKAAFEFDGRTLLDRLAGLLQPIGEKVFVSVNPEQADELLRNKFDCIVDRIPGLGPASGILAAHEKNPGVAWLIVACDLPLLTSKAFEALMLARDHSKAATVFSSPVDGRPEPLCAIYEPDTLARFRDRVEQGGKPSPRDFLMDEALKFVELPDTDALLNINTQDDLVPLKKVLSNEQ
jgi:molybdopterin-guanine dinucleotide biosynthesis protein A